MRSTKLRDGNLVTDGSSFYAIRTPDAKAHLTFTYSTVETRPIELTEEWLERLGFFEHYKSVHAQWTRDGFTIDQHSDVGYDNVTVHPAPEIFYLDGNEVRYVHELQNLFCDAKGYTIGVVDRTSLEKFKDKQGVTINQL